MTVKSIAGLAAAGLVLVPSIRAAGFADSVLQYQSGSGFTPGYTNSASALGEPSRVTPGQFGGPVDPFSPPYLADQLVSIGAGGSLTLHFDSPVPNSPANAFGLDFIVFGSSGFVITNGNYTGGGITDGSLFAATDGDTRVSVSNDGLAWYELTPSLAPVVDRYSPTDGSGDFHSPLDPALKAANFAGKSLAEIRALYKGSAGGTAFDISWARDSQGKPVDLSAIQYLRIDVLSGSAEIDGIAAVPEPAVTGILLVGLAGFAVYARRTR